MNKLIKKLTLEIDGLRLEVSQKPIKGIYLRVKPPEGVLMVSAPLGIDEKELTAFIRINREKINRAINKASEAKHQQALEYRSGELIPFFGDYYRLKLIENHSNEGCEICDKEIILSVPSGASSAKKEAILYDFYKKALIELIIEFTEKWERIWGVKMSGFSFRRQKTIWGSCNRKTRRISYNIELAKYPKECIEYIVAHELLHIFIGGHGKDFKSALTRELPNWRQLNERMKAPPAQ